MGIEERMMYRRMTVKQLEELAAKNKTASEVKQAEKEYLAKQRENQENDALEPILDVMLKIIEEHKLDRP